MKDDDKRKSTPIDRDNSVTLRSLGIILIILIAFVMAFYYRF